MAAGQLRDRALFQKPARGHDGGGGYDVTWEDQFAVWGRLMVGSVRERMEAGRLEASGMAVLRVRRSPATLNVRANWRAIINGVAYQIRQEPDDPLRNHEWLDIEVERGVAT